MWTTTDYTGETGRSLQKRISNAMKMGDLRMEQEECMCETLGTEWTGMKNMSPTTGREAIWIRKTAI